MKNITAFILSFFMLLILNKILAQTNDKILLSEVHSKDALLPDNRYKIVANEINQIDFNRDGLNDIIFDWRRIAREEGDTTYVSVYIQNPDSTFNLFKTFYNLYPIYFKSYDPHVKTGYKRLDSLKSKYAGVFPLHDLKIEDDIILIEYGVGVGEKDSEYYKYNDTLKNWYLERHTFSFEYGSIHEFQEYKVEKNTIPVDRFTYFKW